MTQGTKDTRSFLKKIRHWLEFIPLWGGYHLIRMLPYWGVLALAHCAENFVWFLLWPYRNLVVVNVHAAFPEWDSQKVRAIGKRSIYNLFRNLLEFFWVGSNPKRLNRCYCMPEAGMKCLQPHLEKGEQLIIVTAHLGGWEAAGTIAVRLCHLKLAVVAKAMNNPHLNALLNGSGRNATGGVEVLFSRGAMRGTIKALRNGRDIATLVDQNTRLSEGGVWVDFFGLRVLSSPAPAALLRYCRDHHIPAEIVFSVSPRMEDGRIGAEVCHLRKPLEEYADEQELLQEMIANTEAAIRRYPDQYLWLYKRFRDAPLDASEELKAKYPAYAFE
ncbi:MAG: hypothetical protein PHS41_05680 [Victivallaceae bacterium]|nr:hypothetical protein [Victivallaceae bacterium]